jgi:hypothetical protein
LAKVKNEEKIYYHDVARQDNEPVIIDGSAAAFQVDWKGPDYAVINRHFGWPALQRELRIRTAIDPATGRSMDEALFAYESVVPDGETAWYTEIRLDGVPPEEEERQAVARQLGDLLQALGGEIGFLGKTKAFAAARLGEKWNPAHVGAAGSGSEWVIALQTSALIGDWRALDESAGEEDMRGMYACAFREFSGGALELVRYFARQRLAGGRYLHHRFRKGQDYRPWLVTEAGSVFVLKAVASREVASREKDAAGFMETWQRSNLPLPKWLEEEAKAANRHRWQAIPFLPEGGYGEINVNLACHDGKPLELKTELGSEQ